MRRMTEDGDRSLEVVHIGRRERAKFSVVGAHEEIGEHNMHFRQILGILRRRRKFVLGMTIAGTAFAVAVTFLIPAEYSATAEIMVDPQQADAVGGNPGAVSRTADEVAIAVDTQTSMLSARGHLRRDLDSFAREDDPRTAIFRADPRSAHKSPFASRWGMEQLERRLNVLQLRRSRVISIKFSARNPETAAAVANRIADLHVASTVEARRFQIGQEMAQLAARAIQLRAEMKQAADRLQGLAERAPADADEQHPNMIRREGIVAGEAYARVLRRQKELREQLESITPEAHVFSRATPPDRPSSPSPLLFLFPALIVSLLSAGTLAVLRERLDRKMRSERDVIEALGIPCIALVPRLRRKDRRGGCPSCLGDAFAPYTEAIRSVAVSLRLAEAGNSCLTLLISSSVPGEGKSTFALSLAIYAARIGRRTLLVDFDFRRPSMLRQLHERDESPVAKLTESPSSKLIRRLPDLGIDYLPMPRASKDPLDLFASAHLNAVHRQLLDQYFFLMIQRPP